MRYITLVKEKKREYWISSPAAFKQGRVGFSYHISKTHLIKCLVLGT